MIIYSVLLAAILRISISTQNISTGFNSSKVYFCSVILPMHWRKQSIQILIYIGENMRTSTIFQVNLLPILLQ